MRKQELWAQLKILLTREHDATISHVSVFWKGNLSHLAPPLFVVLLSFPPSTLSPMLTPLGFLTSTLLPEDLLTNGLIPPLLTI